VQGKYEGCFTGARGARVGAIAHTNAKNYHPAIAPPLKIEDALSMQRQAITK